jgi:hypothetical protein
MFEGNKVYYFLITISHPFFFLREIIDDSSFALESSSYTCIRTRVGYSLTVSSAYFLLVKISLLLKAPEVKDAQKYEALKLFMNIVNSGLLNEAAEFSMLIKQSKLKEKDESFE